MPDTFILLRGTEEAIWGDGALADQLYWKTNAYFTTLQFKEESIEWDDGSVLRLQTSMTVREIYVHLKIELDTMSAWAIFQREDEHIESQEIGPINSFRWATNKSPFLQIYLMAKPDDMSFKSPIEDIRKVFKTNITDTVFEFSDGAVLFVSSKEPAKIATRRCARLLQRFWDWAIVDHQGETFSESDGGDVWRDPFAEDDE
jgi:hypothetical protein